MTFQPSRVGRESSFIEIAIGSIVTSAARLVGANSGLNFTNDQ